MTGARRVTGLPDHLQGLDRPLVVGVVNVTPDSFSDGGEFLEPAAAVRHGLALLADGADLLDVGGESTRPGADRVPDDEERRRVLPVVRELAEAGAVVSIDSTRATTVEAALSAGGVLVNDVSGGLADPAMARLVAEAGVPYVVMHSRGPSADMQSRAVYDDVVAEVRAELGQRMDELVAAGVDPAQIVLDPGIGFAKNADHNWALLSHLDALAGLGRPLLVGVSRKAFLGRLLAGPDGCPRPVDRRDAASAAFAALLADAGIWGLRSHEVAATADAVRVGAALRSARVGATEGDRITLRGLRGRGHHGVLAHERAEGQEFVVDLSLWLDTRPAAEHDDLTRTVDYGALAERVVAAIESEPVDLIETLAARIAAVGLAEAAVARVAVTVHKPSAPISVPFADVSVTVVRDRA